MKQSKKVVVDRESEEDFGVSIQKQTKNQKYTLPFTITSVAAKVFELARLCHLKGSICVVVGAAGIGKTVAIKEYSRRNSDVILIEADLSYTTKDLVREIHSKLGLDGGGSTNQMENDVIGKLRGAGRLIIVDEAEHLTVCAQDLLRQINDTTGTGLLFCGLKRKANLKQKRTNLARFCNRVGCRKVTLDALQSQDVVTIIQGVIPGSNGLWKTFYNESYGSFRMLSKLMKLSVRLSEANNTVISSETVRKAAKMLVV